MLWHTQLHAKIEARQNSVQVDRAPLSPEQNRIECIRWSSFPATFHVVALNSLILVSHFSIDAEDAGAAMTMRPRRRQCYLYSTRRQFGIFFKCSRKPQPQIVHSDLPGCQAAAVRLIASCFFKFWQGRTRTPPPRTTCFTPPQL